MSGPQPSARPQELPVVGILACQKQRDNGTSYSRVNDHLARAVAHHCGVLPVLLPAVRGDVIASALHVLDGLVLPGSGSFVHPSRYGDPAADVPGREYDPGRDEVAFHLLSRAESFPTLPILGSCRGMQEIAVAAGGRLYDLEEQAGLHRLVPEPDGDRWAPAHRISVEPDGILSEISPPGRPAGAGVNSQHSQAVAEPFGRMRAEARAPDGVVEAISVDWPHRYVLGIQWHFEHGTAAGSFDQKILRSFGSRCWTRQRERNAAK